MPADLAQGVPARHWLSLSSGSDGLVLSIANILAPVFLVLLLGWVLAATRFLSTRVFHEVNRLTYWVGIPSLLVERIGSTSPEVGAVGGLLAVVMGATLIGMLASYWAARLLGLAPAGRGVFVQGVFRGNLVFVGLPVVLYAFAGDAVAGYGAASSALLTIGPVVVVYNIAAVAVLLLATGGGHAGMPKAVAYGLVTNPILLACAAGLAVSLSGLDLPEVASRTLSAIGQMALPLALLCIGGALHASRIRGSLRPALAGALLKVIGLPAVGMLLALWVGLSMEQTRIALLLLACPTASASYVLVRQLRGDEALASSLIVVSSLLCVPAMAVILALTQ